MTAAVAALAAITWTLKGAGVLAGRLPRSIERRTAGLAPALLAALVVTEVAGRDGIPEPDAMTIGVAVALLLAAVRAPAVVSVVAGAATAALLRALLGWG